MSRLTNKSTKSRATKPERLTRKKAVTVTSDEPAPTARSGTKQALIISLVNRKTGATIDELTKATGWQAHSVRGAISGTLKKKLGLLVSLEKVEGRGSVYRIAGRS